MAPKAKQCVGITALLFGTAALNMHAAAATRVNVVIKRKVIKGSGKNKGRGKGRGKKSRFKTRARARARARDDSAAR